jgi:4a-hydroxytetrahydrobiopterin dehydratase
MPSLLTQSEQESQLGLLPQWQIARDPDRLVCTFVFADFKCAFAFMTAAALHAEQMNHHPDWSNCWNKVTVHLSTHDKGGLTQLDFDLAKAMSQLHANFFAQSK